LHHRLDRDTSGVVLFVKAREANAGVAAQFEGHRVEKVYHALSARPARMPAAHWRVENQLAAVGKGHRSRMQAVEQDGQRAATRFAVLERWPSALLVEARPETGRKHQIRAHLRECGLPILGDGRYEGPLRLGPRAVPRVMLHAARLVLQHPVTGKRLEILADYPDDFRALLAALRRK
jgi:23S rRNA-/tRNA-specific pseudouridylate synthase